MSVRPCGRRILAIRRNKHEVRYLVVFLAIAIQYLGCTHAYTYLMYSICSSMRTQCPYIAYRVCETIPYRLRNPKHIRQVNQSALFQVQTPNHKYSNTIRFLHLAYLPSLKGHRIQYILVVQPETEQMPTNCGETPKVLQYCNVTCRKGLC